MTTADDHRPRHRLALAWLGSFLLMLCVAHGNFESTDAGFTMHAARALWQRGDSGLLTAEQGGELLGERLGAADIAHQQQLGNRRNGKVGSNGRAYVWFPMGHVFLLAPFTAIGDALTAAFPAAEARFRDRVAPRASDEQLRIFPSYVEGHPVLTQSLIAMVVPPACFATSLLLLYLIARRLGADGRDAVWSALAIGFATQAFSVGREQLSDGPGLMLLLAALLPVVELHRGRGGRATAIWAGWWSGAAVLMRYQTALVVVAFAVVLLLAGRRRRDYGALVRFALGGLPLLVVFLAVNHGRFGSVTDTGYPAVGDWFDASPLPGLAKLLFAAGRGVMWLSPLLWLGLPLAWQRRRHIELRWLAWVLFLTPILLFMTARGWQGGQCWASRYLTPGVVGLLAIVLPQTRPWHSWPRLWRVLVALGCFAALTSVIAPVRGVQQLVAQAVRADVAHAVADGSMTETEATAIRLDPADRASWHARYTPLVVNWLYAARSRVGGFEDERGQARSGSANTIEPLFGIAAVEPEQGRAPMRWEDRLGRHLWWRFWGDLWGLPGLILVLPVAVLGAVCSFVGWRRLVAGRTFSAAADGSSDSSTAG